MIATAITLFYFVYDRFIIHKKRNILVYIACFLCLFIVSSHKCHADIKDEMLIEARLTPQQRDEYYALAVKHAKAGYAHAKAADETSLLIPDDYLRDFTHNSICVALAALFGSDPRSKIIGGLIAFLGPYLSGVVKQWKEIETHLRYSEYHFVMSEFYQDVLAADGG